MSKQLYYRSTVIGELPDGWNKAAIDTELVDIQSGFACAKAYAVPSGIPHLRPFNVSTNGEIIITPETVHIPIDFREDMKPYYLQTGDVLFNNTNSVELVGKTAIVRQPLPVAFSNHINRLRIRNPQQIDSRWLALALRHLQEKGFFATHCQKWIGQAGFNQTELALVEIPLPHIQEQRRIVARIEALFEEVREMRRLQEEIESDTGKLMEAILGEVFPPLDQEMPLGWSIKTVADIAHKPQYGYTQSATIEPVGPKFLRITDIQDGRVNWDTVPYCRCDGNCLQKYQLKNDDIVFSRSGTVGRTYLINEPPKEAVFASYLIRLQLTEGLPGYVYWFFQSPGYWRQITPVGAAIPNMNAKVLQQVRIPLPASEEEQRSIVTQLEAVDREIRQMRLASRSDSQLIMNLEQAILSQAFQGRL